VRRRRRRRLGVEAHPFDDRASDHSVVRASDHDRRRAAHHDHVVAVAVAVGA